MLACSEDDWGEIAGVDATDKSAAGSSGNPNAGMWILLCRVGRWEQFENHVANVGWSAPKRRLGLHIHGWCWRWEWKCRHDVVHVYVSESRGRDDGGFWTVGGDSTGCYGCKTDVRRISENSDFKAKVMSGGLNPNTHNIRVECQGLMLAVRTGKLNNFEQEVGGLF